MVNKYENYYWKDQCFSLFMQFKKKKKKFSYLFTRLLQTEFHVGQSTVLLFDVTDQFSQKHLQKAAGQNQHKAAENMLAGHF